MISLTPTTKVSIGLVLLTVSLFLFGDLIGIVPDEERGVLDGRRKFCESLAIQFSLAVTSGNVGLVNATLDSLVNRETDVLSAAVRTIHGRVLAEAGEHARHWVDTAVEKSTSTHVQVPVFHGEKLWGTVEVAFVPLSRSGAYLGLSNNFINLILYLTLVGFIAYWIFIKRTLKELDPRSVIPERVKSAFNALAEGLMIVDEKGQIILANTSFAKKIDHPADALLGKKASRLNWEHGSRREDKEKRLPWDVTLLERTQQTGVALRYQTKRDGTRIFMVNTSPIEDAKGVIRGVLVTFDDLTDLEEKQVELKQTISQLEDSREELREKAVELEYLATRDSLTGCLNRRAFFSNSERLFDEAKRLNSSISCIMADIDHFKSINDRYGHATGDKVIQMIANELRTNGRPDDLVGRYGGEEFCIILPGVNCEEAFTMAERFRLAIKNSSQLQLASSIRITSSFGVAELSVDISNPGELIDRADKALYAAKEGGRNRAVCWNEEEFSGEDVSAGTSEKSGAAQDHERDGMIAQHDSAQQNVEPDTEVHKLRGQIKELKEELVYSQQASAGQSGRDELTGLPNRVLFYDRISQALNRGERFDQISAVVVLDIDMFQRINEALGGTIGDQVIRKAATRLTEMLRETDTVTLLGGDSPDPTVSRTGADEFGILLTDMKDTEMVTWIVKRILDKMSQSMKVDGHEIFITCNAGVSLYPHDADTAGILLENASAARYKAKQRLGKNNLQFYSADINQESYRQLWFESHLHHALNLDELSLDYQPKIDLNTGKITSMEALLRWNNAKLGFVPPCEFIPIAERTGLINEIGEWVIRSACRQAKRWQEAGLGEVGVAVNLSVLQFRQKDLCELIVATLDETALQPGLLELEITESAVMDNFSGVLELINDLHDAGVKLAIDDFGTGYSSLAYLKRLPVNTLKIDRSFLSDAVPDKQDALIITAIIAMAHSLDLGVVAEGVETNAQKSLLEELQCDEIQGYLVSKPVSEDEAVGLLRRYNIVGTDVKGKLISA
jgi:diguanylate cyclase (GGDEF)-like protein/PAS domain S-box-containing protein